MIDLLKRNKPIVVNFYTDRKDVYDCYKIQPMNQFVPQWFKDIDPKYKVSSDSLRTQTNIRGCAGLLSFFRKGFGIPLWSDLRIKLAPKGEHGHQWLFADGESLAEVHYQEQRGSFMPDDECAHLKIITPWTAKCDEDIEFLLTPNTWVQENSDRVVALQGVVNYKYQFSTNINLMFRRSEAESIVDLSCATPLVQLIPLTERKVIAKHHLVTSEELANLKRSPARGYFDRGYLKLKARAKKCPFK